MTEMMNQVHNALLPDEPDYAQAAQLGKSALPHLMQLVENGDTDLAAKATYLAAFINAEGSIAILETAANSHDPIVRIAAAGAMQYLDEVPEALIYRLLADEEIGARQFALRAVEIHRPDNIMSRLQEIRANDPVFELREYVDQIIQNM
ncbi:MAG: hypothetical protein KDI03_06925 [Anaerolineae bacterium]|nr:hypothetical protein [Anaerolineae bacterium]MCB0255002.1 hypothetical protein [Anaerolineae bacterium]